MSNRIHRRRIVLEITETITVVIEPVGPGRDREAEVTAVASEKTRRVVLYHETANFADPDAMSDPRSAPFGEGLWE